MIMQQVDKPDSGPLPQVAGRHRNSALAAERRRRCVEQALSGHTYQQIADAMGYANRGTVHRIVQTALREREVESIGELRELELIRLDALQAAWWGRAMDGDPAAASMVLRIMDRRARILSF